MANGSDGTLIFDTTLDLKGFNEGLNKLQGKVKAKKGSKVTAESGVDKSGYEAEKAEIEADAGKGITKEVTADSGVDKSGYNEGKAKIEADAEAGVTSEVTADSGVDKSGYNEDKAKVAADAKKGIPDEVTADSGVDPSGAKRDAEEIVDLLRRVFKNAGAPFDSDGTYKIPTKFVPEDSPEGSIPGSRGAAGSRSVIAGVLGAGVVQKLGSELLDAGKNAVMLASDLSEVQNVVDVTFGDSAKEINSFAETAMKEYGLSTLQAKQYTGTLGAMIKSMGLADEDVLMMSRSIAGLTGDIASFYNLDHEEAFEKLRSGLSGETEPLKQLGINMSVANLEAYALAEGIEKTYNEMSEAEKVQLRYDYLMQATSDAQGDFARTAGGFANQSRILSGTLAEFGASIASNFMPYIESAMGALTGFLDKLMNRDESGQTELEKQINNTVAELEKIPAKITEIENTFANESIQIGFEYQSSQELLDDYERLQAIEEKNEAVVEEMRSIVEQLTAMYPELSKYVDENGLFAKESEQVRALIGDYRDLAIQKAYTTLITDLSAELVKAQINTNQLFADLENAERELSEGRARLGKIEDTRQKIADTRYLQITGIHDREAADAAMAALQSYLDTFGSFDKELIKAFSDAGITITDLIEFDGEKISVKEIWPIDEFGMAVADELGSAMYENRGSILEVLDIIERSGAMTKTGSGVKALNQEITGLEESVYSAMTALALAPEDVAAMEKALSEAFAWFEAEYGEEAADSLMEEAAKGIENNEEVLETAGGNAIKQMLDNMVTLSKSGGVKAGVGWASSFRSTVNARLKTINLGTNYTPMSYAMSHATGLSYVPYNNYKANLHVGEAVLSAAEAQRWRSGQSRYGGIDPGTLAAIVDAAANKIMNRPVSFGVDGRELATQQAGNNRIAISERNREIAQGVGLK